MSLTSWLLIIFVLKSKEYKPLELLKEFNTFDHNPLNYLRNSILSATTIELLKKFNTFCHKPSNYLRNSILSARHH